MTKTPELLPCPFTGKKPDFIIYPIECGYKYEGKISVDGINLEIYFDGEDKEEVKKKLLNIWNKRVYPKEVKKAVEREKPKKPDNITPKDGYRIGLCKACGTPIDNGDRFCRICGQKLNWSDYE